MEGEVARKSKRSEVERGAGCKMVGKRSGSDLVASFRAVEKYDCQKWGGAGVVGLRRVDR